MKIHFIIAIWNEERLDPVKIFKRKVQYHIPETSFPVMKSGEG